MAEIRKLPELDSWIKGLRDTKARAKVLVRLERLASGNPGDVAPVGEGVSEMRIHFGPGYRVYFKQVGDVITALCGGIKDTQQRDVENAKALARNLEG
jgi:putative addiction module killer protein